MSKTLGSILLVAAAVAVNVIPGVGQAISGALITGIYGAGVAAGTAVAIGGALATALTLGITAAGAMAGFSLVGLGPSLPKPQTTEAAIKHPRPPRISCYGRRRLYGAYALFETASNGTAVDVYAVHDGQMDGIETYYLNDEVVTLTGPVVNEGTDGRYRDGAVNVFVTLGVSPGTAFGTITSLIPEWDSNHRGDGIVMIGVTSKSVKAKYFQEAYPQSSPPVPSIAGRWLKCPNPSAGDPTDEGGWTWTENSVRHLLHYKLVHEGVDYATKIEPAIDSWISAANHCAGAVALKAGGTEGRYRSCVAFRHTDARKDVIGEILSTFDGWMAPRPDGALVVYSGRYYTPTVDIGPDEIVSYAWETGVDDDKAVNELIVSYVSSAHDFNSVEADAWRDEEDITARGQVLSQPIDMQVPSHGQARRLAKRKMARILSPYRGTITTNVAGRIVRGHRYINLHIEEAGAIFYSGPAEITALTRNMATGGVTFTWVAVDPNIDAWNAAAEEGEPAAEGTRVAPSGLVAPVITTASLDGGTLSLEVSSPDRDDLVWYVRAREQGATLWGPISEYPDVDPGTAVVLQTDIVAADKVLEFQAAYLVGDGRFSEWSNIATVNNLSGKPAPTNFTYEQGDPDGVDIFWRNPTDSRFSYYQLRGGSSSTDGGALIVEAPGALGATETSHRALASGATRYYWVRAYYSDGSYSVVGPLTVTAA